ncbi:hypothetical protein BBO99_00002962 [Phytophthora kernoviae]|uniref:RRM domain-containing protein n=1 Tax=Phytophthora kernoviae TaxID=325452 RepID=A0A421GV64_9STRA|nr:hypothetical protein JM16_002698 [Phytophthora kernoviae]KAG2528139.1 hypothetical protein JM18_003358 [Phytophthora kernoviae]RLN82332.1 hypothetical protein BBO99_00002962 [Phytophthora kernoviae]
MADTTKLGKIFIGGLSYETTDEKLRAYFGAYGTVTDAVVMKDPISRRSRGFGFITYADPVCVDRALTQPNHILDSRRVEAKRAVPRAESLRDIGNGAPSNRGNGTNSISSLSMNSAVGATKKIFVGGLHYETKDADFKKYFMQYGKVVSAEVMFNRETNKSRGFGFVIFESEDSVELVLQDKNHIIDGKSVEVKRAVPRTDVPPPRSVSSRGGSFSGPSGPGSVGSLDDINATPPVSLSGSMPSSSGLTAVMGSEKLSRASSASASIKSSGTLVGYAAAVRGMMGMGMGLTIDRGFGGDNVGRGAFGMHTESDNSAQRYSSLSGFLQQDYLPPNHAHQQPQDTAVSDLPLDSASFGRMMSGETTPDIDDPHKEPSSLEYDLPSSAAEFHRQYR